MFGSMLVYVYVSMFVETYSCHAVQPTYSFKIWQRIPRVTILVFQFLKTVSLMIYYHFSIFSKIFFSKSEDKLWINPMVAESYF